jgi:hypothetical protein
MDNMNQNNAQVAYLESRIDHLETEITYLDKLLLDCGFPEGIRTLKFCAEELIQESGNNKF